MKLDVLFLAQIPPPIHGVTAMSKRVKAMMESMPELKVEQLWMGGAHALKDVGRINLRKLMGFAGLMLRLGGRWLCGQRHAFTYQTLATSGDAPTRDAVVIALSKRLTKRVLVHLHTQGLDAVLAGRGWRNRFLRWALEGTELIAISGHVGKMARDSGLFARVHDLPNLVDDPNGSNTGAADVLRVGYLSNFDPRKGVLRFIDCVAALKAAGIPVEARLAGGPTKHLSVKDLVTYVRHKGVADVVTVLGFVSEEEKHRLLDWQDLFIYPTDHDLAPLVVLESMARCTVPVVFDTGGLRELVGPHFANHVITEKLNPEAYTAQVTALAQRYWNDRSELALAKQTARDHYLANYTPEIYIQRLAAILGTSLPTVPVQATDSHRAA